MPELIKFTTDGTPVTDTVIIAAGAEVTHQAAIKLVHKYQKDFETFGRVGFEIQPFETKGGKQSREVALLNEDQTTLLLTFFKNTEIVRAFKVRLVKAFRECRDELEKAKRAAFAKLPDFTDPAAAATAWAEQYKKRKVLEDQVKKDAPKVEFTDSVIASDTELTVTATAKTLSISPRKFSDWLRVNGFLYKQSTQATQLAIERGYMVVRFVSIRHDDSIEQKPYPHVTGAGLFYFYGKLRKDGLIARNEQLELIA